MMPTAVVKTKSGATVTIQGSQAEVAGLLAQLEGAEPKGSAGPRQRRGGGMRPTPTGLLSELIAEGFFSEPRDLGTVTSALKQKGHFYPVTTLSPAMLRLVRKKDLRRLKENKRWTYVR